jgi:hypothetical protein
MLSPLLLLFSAAAPTLLAGWLLQAHGVARWKQQRRGWCTQPFS